MNRDEMISRINTPGEVWDFIIIGGGATGIGCAIEASSRGYKTLLLEKNDFGKASSSRSTKLIHGGVRYLQQGNVSLVYEALKERGYLLKNAPHLVHNIAFAVPGYDWWENPYYGAGLKLYDLMAGRMRIGRSKWISKKMLMELVPTIEPEGLRGGVVYYDGQFDDARLIINMAQTASEHGGTVINYTDVRGLLKEKGRTGGVIACDLETGQNYELKAKAVINATGIFSDSVRQMDQNNASELINPSQGIHIVLDKGFLPGSTAVLIPSTDDKRVLFAIPWKGHVLVGTTDTPVRHAEAEPKALFSEIEFLLSHISRYLIKKPVMDDILSVFAGIRPLVNASYNNKAASGNKNTASASRDFKVEVSPSSLISVAGGKWTTYRKMAEDTVNQAINTAGLKFAPSVSKNLHIHGFSEDFAGYGNLKDYGSDAPEIEKMVRKKPELGEKIHPGSNIISAEVVWAVRNEMARTVEDFLSRRRRMLLLNARLSIEMAPETAKLMAGEMKRSGDWVSRQIEDYNRLAASYLPEAYMSQKTANFQ